jgi:predicted nucleic acid-binding protein
MVEVTVMADRLLLDSNVLIDFLRQRAEAVSYVQRLADRPFMSAVVVGELYSGVKDGPERERLDRLVTGFRVIRLTREIAAKGGLYVRQYSKSHAVGLADGLIAATADAVGATLVTLNMKHFPMLVDVRRPY